MRQITQARAAVFFFHRQPQQAHVAKLAPHVHREFVAAVDAGGAWRQLFGNKLLHAIAQHVDIVAQGEVEAGVGNHLGLLDGPQSGPVLNIVIGLRCRAVCAAVDALGGGKKQRAAGLPARSTRDCEQSATDNIVS
jgi:hypothetical protein